MKSSRLTVLLDPDEKRSLEDRAASLSLSTSELVRRAVDSYDPEADSDTLLALADQLQAVAERVGAKLDRLEALFDASDRLDEMRPVWREEARRELAAVDDPWPFDERG